MSEAQESLDRWIGNQYRHSATSMLASISPVELVKSRPGFGQTIQARPGAVVASPQLAAYDPDPDYFFHWYRDSAVVIDALRVLVEDTLNGSLTRCNPPVLSRAQALRLFADFVLFTLSLRALDGRRLVASPGWRAHVAPDFAKFLRTEADLSAVHGDAVSGETRVNPDGSLDISSWSRPQNDGPPLRALILLRWLRSVSLGPEISGNPGLASNIAELVRSDLAFTYEHWREPCFDIWEEEKGLHYYTLCVAAAALEQGADWLDGPHAQLYRTQAQTIGKKLDGYWLEDEGYYRSRALETGQRSLKELDIAVILAAIHTSGTEGRGPDAGRGPEAGRGPHAMKQKAHSVNDPRMHATLARLESLFEAAYPINRERAGKRGTDAGRRGTDAGRRGTDAGRRGTAMGRYAGDVYYSGGAYYFSTLAAAEFCFRAAAGADHEARGELVSRGDAFLETVRAFTPPTGDLSEQFDQQTGAQTSAKQLAWSHAAFISCIGARRRALASYVGAGSDAH